MHSSPPNFTPLSVTVVGAGLGGLCAALALRREGHEVVIYEHRDFEGDTGANLGIVSNELVGWSIGVWDTGEIVSKAATGDYKEKFGFEAYGFQRCDIHDALLRAVQQESGTGPPCKLVLNRRVIDTSPEIGQVTFENGETITADVVIGADGGGSRVRATIGIIPDAKRSARCCYRSIIASQKLRDLGLDEFINSRAIEFWATKDHKIVAGCAHGFEIFAMYCFYPASVDGLEKDDWYTTATPQQLVDTFPTLDSRLRTAFLHATDIHVWRLYVHSPYLYWVCGRTAILGDAAHPMLPDQAQGFGMAIEDAAALGLVFSRDYLGDGEQGINTALTRYEKVRKERATRVQDASLRASTDLSERIGWSTGNERPGKMTIEDLCNYEMEAHLKQVIAAELQI